MHQWLVCTDFGEETADEALESVADEEVNGAFLHENQAQKPEIWIELGFTEEQAKLLAKDVEWVLSGSTGERPSHVQSGDGDCGDESDEDDDDEETRRLEAEIAAMEAESDSD